MKKIFSIFLLICIVGTMFVFGGCDNIFVNPETEQKIYEQSLIDEQNSKLFMNAIEKFHSEYKEYLKIVEGSGLNFFMANEDYSKVISITNIKKVDDIEEFENKYMDKNYKTVKSPKILKKIFDLYITQDFSLTSQLDGYSFWYSYQYGIVWTYKTDATAQEISEYIMNNTTYSGDPLTKEVVWINIST